MLEVDLVSSVNSYLYQKGILYSNELRMGIGIPDITFNIGGSRRLKPLDDYFLVSILAYINEKKFVSVHKIYEVFAIGVGRVKQYISVLTNLSLIEIKENIVRILKNIFAFNLGITISIEAKLKDWRGACLQAQRYLCFSDYSYVALPSKVIKNVDYRLYESEGIGLLSIDGNKVFEVIPPVRSSTCDHILKYISTSKVVESNTNTTKKHLRSSVFSNYV